MQKAFYLILFLHLSVFAYSQSLQDTTFLQASIHQAINIYHTRIHKQLNIYNGRAYKPYNPTDEEHPYYLTDDWTQGSILYESDYYNEIPLMYDLSADKVLTENPFNGTIMEMVYNKIERFEILHHTFVKLVKDKSFTPEMSEGFYELLYNGQLKLYAKRSKNYRERTEGLIIHQEFDEKNKYFLFTGKIYVRVTGKKSITHALGDKKKLPKPPGMKIDPNSNNKFEDKLIYLTEFYNLNSSSL